MVSAEDIVIVELDDMPLNSCVGLSLWVDVAGPVVLPDGLSSWVEVAAPFVVPVLAFDRGPILLASSTASYLVVIRGRWIKASTGI